MMRERSERIQQCSEHRPKAGLIGAPTKEAAR